jgi:hypothetical protein
MTPFVNTNGNYGPCPAGYYCPAGTSTPVACPIGTYSSKTIYEIIDF